MATLRCCASVQLHGTRECFKTFGRKAREGRESEDRQIYDDDQNNFFFFCAINYVTVTR
ncbi:unnamed protein product [Coffea canephora]|uniref:Uncharacterized protein n=1 Tax=Coffea canephora TaxID=49390 RepID=A0A068TRV8_COFCA|nr:unnamed protein product [Coffea canephora]